MAVGPALSRWFHRRRERALNRAYQRRLYADLARIGQEFKPRFAAAQDGAAFDDVLAEYLEACRVPEVQLEALESRKLRRKAWDHGVAVPPTAWEYDEVARRRYVSPEERRRLYAAIRHNRIAVVREWVVALAPFGALLVGLLGTLLGLSVLWAR